MVASTKMAQRSDMGMPLDSMDEEAALKRAMALSLVTVEEDEQRRKAKYSSWQMNLTHQALPKSTGTSPTSELLAADARSMTSSRSVPDFQSNGLVGKMSQEAKSTSSSGQGHTTVSTARPRPQPVKCLNAGFGLVRQRSPSPSPLQGPPAVPPRPSTKPDSMQRTGKRMMPPPPPPIPKVGPNVGNTRSSVIMTDRSGRMSPCVLQAEDTSPRHALKGDTTDNKPVPLRPPPPHLPRPIRVSVGESGAGPSPQVPRRTGQTSVNIDSPEEKPLITLSPPLIPKNSLDFDLSSLDPFSSVNINKLKLAHEDDQIDTASSHLHGFGMKSTGITQPTELLLMPRKQEEKVPRQPSPSPEPKKISSFPPLATNKNHTSVPMNVRKSMEGIKNESKSRLPVNAGVNSDAVRVRKISDEKTADVRPTSTNSQVSIPSDPLDDLIDLGDEDDYSNVWDFMSLESFDPLMSVDQTGANNEEETLQLFPNLGTPLSTGSRMEARNPFPIIDPARTQEILKKISGEGGSSNTEKKYKHYQELNLKTGDDSRESSTEKEANTAMLQDPFSVMDLNVALEERKRTSALKEQVLEEEAEMAEKKPERPARPPPMTHVRRGRPPMTRPYSFIQDASYEVLKESQETAEDEVKAFCQMVARLRAQFANDDPVTNKGLVLSPKLEQIPYPGMTVKVLVDAKFVVEPVIFTCDLKTCVEHVISHVLLTLCDDLGNSSTDDFILKVHGLSEFLSNGSALVDYEYVQNCLMLDQDIRLTLVSRNLLKKSLLRTPEDDKQPVFVPKARDTDDKVTKHQLGILMDTVYKEMDKLRDTALQGSAKLQCKPATQAVKAICAMLCKVETIDIIKAVRRLQAAVKMEKTLKPSDSTDLDAFVYVTKEGETLGSVVDTDDKSPVPAPDSPLVVKVDDIVSALEELTTAVKGLVDLYCRTFHTDFQLESTATQKREKKAVTDVRENLIVHLASIHRLPLKWRERFEDYEVVCGLYYGGEPLCPEVRTKIGHCCTEGFQDAVIWDEWLLFESIDMCKLPREARLCFSLIGYKTVQSGSDSSESVKTPLGWVALQVFNHKYMLVQGSQLLGLWAGEMANPTGTVVSNSDSPNSVLLQVNLPDFGYDVSFPPISEVAQSAQQQIQSLHPSDREQLDILLQRDLISSLEEDEAEMLWEKRHYLYELPHALPRVLESAPAWDWPCLMGTYTMLGEWKPLQPTDALTLLMPRFADTHVRTVAVSWIKEMSSDELYDYLPCLVQALKFESYHNSALARLLLERSVASVRVAHQLYWLLKEAADDVRHRKRYQLMFGALMSVVGEAMRHEFTKQEDLVKMLSAVAEKIKAAKEKEAVLHRELTNLWDFLENQDTIRLPLNPSMEISGIDAKSCSYFTSNAFPLKLVLKNIDPKAVSIYTMFKVGDDLRQDLLTMQMIRIMDKLWRQEGLDLKIITFRCQPTGNKRGLVELVTEAETLRKIQVKHGVGGSFKDRPIAEWLQIQNPTELEYQKAVDNFTSSCAGYCVATYILGICDRHNDNIMIKQSGHMFHIDFGKFLGDSQMFGNIKRDRVPFVLTSDMAYVINGGDKPSHKFQQFIDLCSQAFNILRKHTDFFLSLFSLLAQSGIPGVNDKACKYVQRALLPHHTDTEATAMFTRMIEESLKSMFTQINFFIHNLAQMKFSGHTEGALLSFIPKTYSLATDGKIKNIEVYGYQKRYNPEKYYIYIIRVERENQRVPSFIFRRYSEFCEFHNRLVLLYPLAHLPSLPGKVYLGRTHVQSVAEARKLELEKFLRQLLQLAPEISEHDLVYTFFHPMLRDEQDVDKTDLGKLKERPLHPVQERSIKGQIKLSLVYRNDCLTVMIMHVKDLVGGAGEAPDPYVKTYLLPDTNKLTKRKTKIAHGTFHPTFNEVLTYQLPLEDIKLRSLQVTVWSYDTLKENEFLGAVLIKLAGLNLTQETAGWHDLRTLEMLGS